MAHANIIDMKSLYAYKGILRNSLNFNEFNRAQEGDRVNSFQKTIIETLSYTDCCHGVMTVGSETGYWFEQEVYIKLCNFFQNIDIYERELRYHDPSARDIQDRVVDLLRQVFTTRESKNYLYNGSYCAKFIPSSPPGTREYDNEIANQIKLVDNNLSEVQALLIELWSYVETRIR